MITTPSNPLILNSCGGLNLADSAALKAPITLKDFEQNLLSESAATSTTSTPATATNSLQQQQQPKQPMFFLGNLEPHSSNYIQPNQLSFIHKKSEGSKRSKDSKSKTGIQ